MNSLLKQLFQQQGLVTTKEEDTTALDSVGLPVLAIATPIAPLQKDANEFDDAIREIVVTENILESINATIALGNKTLSAEQIATREVVYFQHLVEKQYQALRLVPPKVTLEDLTQETCRPTLQLTIEGLGEVAKRVGAALQEAFEAIIKQVLAYWEQLTNKGRKQHEEAQALEQRLRDLVDWHKAKFKQEDLHSLGDHSLGGGVVDPKGVAKALRLQTAIFMEARGVGSVIKGLGESIQDFKRIKASTLPNIDRSICVKLPGEPQLVEVYQGDLFESCKFSVNKVSAPEAKLPDDVPDHATIREILEDARLVAGHSSGFRDYEKKLQSQWKQFQSVLRKLEADGTPAEQQNVSHYRSQFSQQLAAMNQYCTYALRVNSGLLAYCKLAINLAGGKSE